MSDCTECYSGVISWMDSCGCCTSERFCDCPKGVAAKEEAAAVREFKHNRAAALGNSK